MDYYRFNFKVQEAHSELLIALLSVLPFDVFQEIENGLEAYMPVKLYSQTIPEQIDAIRDRINFEYKRDLIVAENWNKEWETNFHPVRVGNFCALRADFHEPIPGVRYELVITPKMAFGTGHHETTYMMIQLMENLKFKGEVVLDYGCGTGVLAILASKLGASEIDAVDIETEAFQNTIENCETNEVSNVNASHGTLSDVSGNGYGIVLANINRNVILDSLPALSQKIKSRGILVISGFVDADEERMKNALQAAGFRHENTLHRNNWLAMQCYKP